MNTVIKCEMGTELSIYLRDVTTCRWYLWYYCRDVSKAGARISKRSRKENVWHTYRGLLLRKGMFKATLTEYAKPEDFVGEHFSELL